MDKDNERQANRSMAWKIAALIFILIECNLTAGSIFGFASLFPVLQRYRIYRSECFTPSAPVNSNQTKTTEENCQGQMAQYQLAFTLGIAFFNLPAVLLGMINDAFGARSLKLIGILFHLISWLSLWFIRPGYDWLLHVHTIFLALAGICTLLASFAIAAHFQKIRGLISTFISGAQLSGSIWYGIFQVLIDREVISLPHLALIWASLSVVMLISAFLFFDFRWPSTQSSSTSKPARERAMKANTSQNTFMHHLTSPLFILVALFLSFLLLSISYLPIIWFPWLMYLTKGDLKRSTDYTFMYNMSAASGLIIAPICGLLVDYKIARGYQQKLLNISILQSLTWTFTVILCIVCMFQSVNAALTAMVIMLFSRAMLVAGSQALIITVFPGQYIGSLIGALWTTAGVISFAIYGLTRLASHPTQAWRSWTVILCLCLVMFCHLIQLWCLYVKANKQKKSLPLPRTEEELQILN